MLCREELAEEMECSQDMDPSDVPAESQFLLDFDIDDIWRKVISLPKNIGY
jgi:hypothetical protein